MVSSMNFRCTGILQVLGRCAAMVAWGILPAHLPAADFTAPHQPVYVFLASHITDHVNLAMTEDRLRRTLPVLERLRTEHPEFKISETCLFTGVLSQVLAERNSETGIKDFIQGYIGKGLVEPGYDATDEPTYQRRPVPDYSHAQTAEDRWLARSDAAEKLLTEYRDRLTGISKPGKIGGLQLMQEIFGPAAFIQGITDDLGGDPETMYRVSRYNSIAIMPGIPDPTIHPRGIHGFRGSASEFGKINTTGPDASSELYWQDNFLRLAETTDADLRVVMASEGPDALQKVLANLSRNRVRIIQVEIADQRMYLRPSHASGPLFPPLTVAYNYPNSPTLPAEAFRPALEIDQAYGREDALLGWLVNSYFPANPGCRFISNAELRERVGRSVDFDIATEDLIKALPAFIKHWSSANYPPNNLEVSGRFLSLADTFAVLTDALAERHRTGKLPAATRLAKVYGPVEMDLDHGPVGGTVSVASIMARCAELAGPLHDRSFGRMPRNTIPTWIAVDGIKVNAAQYLRLMAQSLPAPSPDTKLDIKMSYMFSVGALVFPKTRVPREQGGTWTFKPAPLKLAALQPQH